MSGIQISFVIASNDPLELANFYSQINCDKVFRGFKSDHYFLSLRNGCKIHFYRAKENLSFKRVGNSASLCFQKNPSSSPYDDLDDWISRLVQLGALGLESPRLEAFGAEMWMQDPEGNQFLILIPFESIY